jgi:hypothetical protein
MTMSEHADPTSPAAVPSTSDWPPLPYGDWRETRDTLHMYTQVVGKLRLALSPSEPEWAHVALYLTPRGLTTTAIPSGLRTFDVEFDLIDHRVVLRDSDGRVEEIPLHSQAVADFHAEVVAALGRLDIRVTISPLPSEVSDPIPFTEDRTHHTYDPAFAHRFWRVLAQVDVVMKRHRARFTGRTTPVQFFWGSFDLAMSRFSGRPAQPPPGADSITRRSADAEAVCAGFWPGNEATPYPAFFAYAYPRPDGIENAEVRPAAARWDEQTGLFLLAYDDVREAADPEQAITDFLESTYDAGARLLQWSDSLLSREP